MKVIVKEAGFYGGTWHEANGKEQEISDKVARAFLPPHGNQLSLPEVKKVQPSGAGGEKPVA